MPRQEKLSLVFCGITLLCTHAVMAEQRAIDTEKSLITVHVSKAGFFSGLGHDHEIAAPIAHGTVDTSSRQVEVNIKAGAFQVRDPKGSDKDRSLIQHTMLGPDVLDAERYPEIAFRSTGAELAAAGSWRVQGILTLHGQTRPIAMDARETDGHFVGRLSVRQTDFDIKPVKVAGGTIQVKDEIVVEFDIQLAR